MAAAAVAVAGGATLMVFSLAQTSSSAAPSAAAGDKVTICHRTDSNTNPYVVITPDAAGVFNGHLGPDGHAGPVFDAALGQKAAHIKWGDIIPPFTWNGVTYSQNWDAAGQAIFNNGCNPVEATPSVPPPSS